MWTILRGQIQKAACGKISYAGSFKELIESLNCYPIGEDLEEVLWRSLIFDSENYGTRASARLAEPYRAWLEELAFVDSPVPDLTRRGPEEPRFSCYPRFDAR
jgi:hypothetical protein